MNQVDDIPQEIERIALLNAGDEYSPGRYFYQGRSYTIHFNWSDMDDQTDPPTNGYILFEPDTSPQGLAWHYFCNVYRDPAADLFEVLDCDEHPDIEQDLMEAQR
jgi:hypothetical protein